MDGIKTVNDVIKRHQELYEAMSSIKCCLISLGYDVNTFTNAQCSARAIHSGTYVERLLVREYIKTQHDLEDYLNSKVNMEVDSKPPYLEEVK
jgi:hypothetical protein